MDRAPEVRETAGAASRAAAPSVPRVSVIVPVRDGARFLERCLPALFASRPAPLEVIVADDGSRDASAEVARRHGARVLVLDRSSGPAAARNRAAEVARGEILFFTDADVVVGRETIARALACLAADPAPAAVIGSYDDRPEDPGFISQFKNLFHHFVHQTGREQASTFWTGCGAIRRELFLALGGFNEGYPTPSIEDIELGFRMRLGGHRIRLEKSMQATHLKRWGLFDLIRTDVFRRGVPWIALMLRDRYAMKDLNLSAESRANTLLAGLLVIALAGLVLPGSPALPLLFVAAVAFALILWLSRRLLGFFREKRGLLFAVRVVPMHLLFLLYSGACVPLGMIAYRLDRRRARRHASGPAVARLAPLAARPSRAGMEQHP